MRGHFSTLSGMKVEMQSMAQKQSFSFNKLQVRHLKGQANVCWFYMHTAEHFASKLWLTIWLVF